MVHDELAARICIAILAAGQAKRFGESKLLHRIGGRPLLHRSLAAAAKAFPGSVCLVTGKHADAVAAAGTRFADRTVFNPDFAKGIGTSIATATGTCSETADAIMIVLADQPLVTPAHLTELFRTWNGESNRIVATEFAGTLGPPVLFGHDYFDELRELKDDSGAKHILRSNPQCVIAVNFEPASIDIDSLSDLEALDNL